MCECGLFHPTRDKEAGWDWLLSHECLEQELYDARIRVLT
jgi:hypothetical protein